MLVASSEEATVSTAALGADVVRGFSRVAGAAIAPVPPLLNTVGTTSRSRLALVA